MSDYQVRRPNNWSAIVQLLLSVAAALLLLGIAAVIVVVNVSQSLFGASGAVDLTQPFMTAASLAFAGALVVPSAWYSWKEIASPAWVPQPKPVSVRFELTLTLVTLVLVVGVLLLGNWISSNTSLAWLFLPPLNLVANGLPALWLIYIGTHGLIHGSPRRRWGVFAGGLVLGPLVILVLELLLLLLMVILITLWAFLNPALLNQLYSLAYRLQNAPPSPDAILPMLVPFLINPGVLLIGFTFISILVPLIEEALKPVGVWMLARRKLSPADGFAFGVLSGVGFGLFENLGNTSGGGEAWALVASTRIATLMLHGFTAGLVGWAIASAFTQHRYLRLVFTYLLAVFVHGLWNGMAVLGSISSLESIVDVSIPTTLVQLGNISSIGIFVLGALILLVFVSLNSLFRRQYVHQPPGAHPGSPPHTAIPASSVTFGQDSPNDSEPGASIPPPFDPDRTTPIPSGEPDDPLPKADPPKNQEANP